MNTLLLISIVVLAFMLTVIAIYYFGEAQAINESREEYNKRYVWIQNNIREWGKNEHNYQCIKRQLTRLGQTKYKNREKTAVLTCMFFRDWTEFRLKEMNYELTQQN